MQKARGHSAAQTLRKEQQLLPLIVSTWFQVLFHSPPGVLFTVPSRYWFTIGQLVVFSLRKWSSRIPAGFLVSRGTWELGREDRPLSPKGLSPSMVLLSRRLRLTDGLFDSLASRQSARPVPQHRSGNACRLDTGIGLGFSPFARHYSGNGVFYLFLRLLRCFTSPGSPSGTMDSSRNVRT